MSAQRTLALAWTVALVTALAAVFGMASLSTGATPAGLGFSQGYDSAAFRLLAGGSSPEILERARILTVRALEMSPYDNNARLRLAYIDRTANGRLTQAGEAHFAMSYDLIPVDENVAAWRIKFGLENWRSLSARSRMAVQHEVETFDQFYGRAVDTRGILSSISDPSGRLTAALWLHSLETGSSSNAAKLPELAE